MYSLSNSGGNSRRSSPDPARAYTITLSKYPSLFISQSTRNGITSGRTFSQAEVGFHPPQKLKTLHRKWSIGTDWNNICHLSPIPNDECKHESKDSSKGPHAVGRLRPAAGARNGGTSPAARQCDSI